MTENTFFDEPTDQSLVKITIITKYFEAWCNVMKSVKTNNRLGLIDLFAGPGSYGNGQKSTPLIVLEKAIADPQLASRLVTIFNEGNSEYFQLLRDKIRAIPGIERLQNQPLLYNKVIGEDIAKIFEKVSLIPTLLFVDPWGYKGLSLRLINAVLRNWGCDCIFFFNYNRINAGLNNPYFIEHMQALFGIERAEELRNKLTTMSPQEREVEILEQIAQALKSIGGTYVLPFCFKNAEGNRTSHHLILVSKSFKAYHIMKRIMAKESTDNIGGVPSFEYNPAGPAQPTLFDLLSPLSDLGPALLKQFTGKRLKMSDIYERHSIGKPFTDTHYKTVLKELEAQGKISCNPPAESRRKNTFKEDTVVKFPSEVE